MTGLYRDLAAFPHLRYEKVMGSASGCFVNLQEREPQDIRFFDYKLHIDW
jgi:hypothetical protein